MLELLDTIVPYVDTTNKHGFEDYGVPCNVLLSQRTTAGWIKTDFCRKWIAKTEEIINKKPEELPFCKVVAMISRYCMGSSRIIIFYDEHYYKTFWNRNNKYQIWSPIENGRSFALERGISTNLTEKGYIAKDIYEDYIYRDELWFYGELPN